MPFLDIAAPEFRESVRTRFEVRMAGEPVPSVYEMKIQCKNGLIKDIEISAKRFNYIGKPAISTLIRDITVQKRAEEEIKLQRILLLYA